MDHISPSELPFRILVSTGYFMSGDVKVGVVVSWATKGATLGESLTTMLSDPGEKHIRAFRANLDVTSTGERTLTNLTARSPNQMASCHMKNHVSGVMPPS